MGRLYYDKQPSGGAKSLNGNSTQNNYLTKIAALIPSEIIAAYLTMMGIAPALISIGTQQTAMIVIFLLGLILTPFYLNHAAEADKPKRNHLILSSIAFIVWAYVTTGKELFESLHLGQFDQAAASLVLIAFSLISGLVPLNK